MWIMFLYRIDVGPLSDRYADIPTSYRYLSDMGMLTGSKWKLKIGFQNRLSIIAGQKYCRMLSMSILQYFRLSSTIKAHL